MADSLKYLSFFGLLAVLALGLCGEAQADVDQLCLRQCTGMGNSPANCMANCSYNIPLDPTTKPGMTATHNVHDTVNAPTPLDNEIALQKPVQKPGEPSVDYACLIPCTQSGFQYDLCKIKCMKPNCVSGSTAAACSGVSRVLNGASVPAPAAH